jgi:zinc transport system ATP-binding protein
MNKIIEIENLFFSYNGETILEDINLSIEEGDFWGIIGPNGAGKTTLLKIIVGLLKPQKGKIFIFGKYPWHLKEEKKYIGYIPQKAEIEELLPLKVFDIVSLGRRAINEWRRLSSKDIEIIEKILRELEIYELKEKLFKDLSGGQKQRVLIAKALVMEPKILLLDEPTVGVDLSSQDRFYNILEELNKNGLTIILISHDIGVISKKVKKLACLNRKLFLHGCPQDIRIHKFLSKMYGEEVFFLTHEGEEEK